MVNRFYVMDTLKYIVKVLLSKCILAFNNISFHSNQTDSTNHINPKRLFIDITSLHEYDHKTGIQRVVRSILSELESSNNNYEVCPVYQKQYLYKSEFRTVSFPNNIISPQANDIFLGLDLNYKIIYAQRQIKQWKNRGVIISFIVYDIIPISHPEWWGKSTRYSFAQWLAFILTISNHVISISKSVQDQVERFYENEINNHKSVLPEFSFFHLGANIEKSQPTCGLPENYEQNIEKIRSNISFLMVGTIEPRKGHQQVLEAFEKLWEDGQQYNLVVIGKKGWLVDNLIDRLDKHERSNQQLFWLEDVSDEYLQKIYEVCSCLIAASFDEGFGLPLIEAAQYNLPIIARQIPIFQEVAGNNAYYFDSNFSSNELAECINNWVDLYYNGNQPKSYNIVYYSWKQSKEELMNRLGIVEET